MIHLFQSKFSVRQPNKTVDGNFPARKKRLQDKEQSPQRREPVMKIGHRYIFDSDLQAATFALTLICTILVFYNFIQRK
jgi:hypothetical protein